MSRRLAQFKCLVSMGLQAVRGVREKCGAALAHRAGQAVRECAGTLKGAALRAPAGRTCRGAGVEERRTRHEAPDLTSRSENPHGTEALLPLSVHPLRPVADGRDRLVRRPRRYAHRASPLPRVHAPVRLATTDRSAPDPDSVDRAPAHRGRSGVRHVGPRARRSFQNQRNPLRSSRPIAIHSRRFKAQIPPPTTLAAGFVNLRARWNPSSVSFPGQ